MNSPASASQVSDASPFETVSEAGRLQLTAGRPLLLRTKSDVYRTMVVDQTVCDVARITTRDVSLVGRAAGQTHVTFFFEDAQRTQLTYLIDVHPEPAK